MQDSLLRREIVRPVQQYMHLSQLDKRVLERPTSAIEECCKMPVGSTDGYSTAPGPTSITNRREPMKAACVLNQRLDRSQNEL